MDEFRTRLQETRQRGYGEVHEVYEEGTSSVAAAVWDKTDRIVVATVSVAGPEVRMQPQRVLELTELVKAAAEELSQHSAGIRVAAR